jgi:hypothetical protein
MVTAWRNRATKVLDNDPQRPPATAGSALPSVYARQEAPPEDAVTARQTLLDGLARDTDIFEASMRPCTREITPSPAKQQAPVRSAGRSGLPVRAEPDLLDEAAWWQTDDFWRYALFAAVAYIRAAASRYRAGWPWRWVRS